MKALGDLLRKDFLKHKKKDDEEKKMIRREKLKKEREEKDDAMKELLRELTHSIDSYIKHLPDYLRERNDEGVKKYEINLISPYIPIVHWDSYGSQKSNVPWYVYGELINLSKKEVQILPPIVRLINFCHENRLAIKLIIDRVNVGVRSPGSPYNHNLKCFALEAIITW